MEEVQRFLSAGMLEARLKSYASIHPEIATGILAAIKCMEGVPSCSVKEVISARWIEVPLKPGDSCRRITCSNCGRSSMVSANVPYDHYIMNKNYCDLCGADMERR